MTNILQFDIKRPINKKGKFIAGKASVRTTAKGWAYMKRSDFEKVAKAVFLHNTPKNWRKDGAFSVKILCYFAIEKTATKKQVEQKSGYYYTKKPDSDNISKGIQDAMSGTLYNDDRQVALLEVSKFYQCSKDEPPLAIVTVERLGDEF